MTTKKLEEMIEQLRQENRTSLTDEMFEQMQKEQFILPAVLPKNTSPEVMRQIIDNQGKNQPLPDGVNPGACVIQNGQGESFIPLFTSREEMAKGSKNFPLSLEVAFETAAQMVQQEKEIMGIVLNPFSHNVVMRLNRDNAQEKPVETEEITVEQYHALARRQMEADYLPRHLFEQREPFIKKLCDEKGSLLKEMYQELYQEEIACPYVEDDFEFMTLNISDTFLVSQISMPSKNRYPHLSKSIIYGYDSEKDKIWYYAIVYEGKGAPDSLVQVIETGEPKNLGEAPPEGSELSTVLDLMQA